MYHSASTPTAVPDVSVLSVFFRRIPEEWGSSFGPLNADSPGKAKQLPAQQPQAVSVAHVTTPNEDHAAAVPQRCRYPGTPGLDIHQHRKAMMRFSASVQG